MKDTTVNDSKVQVLATLLDKAMDKLEVGLRTQQEPLPTERYWLGLMTLRQSWWFRDVHSEAMSTTTLRIKQKGLKEELFEIIVQELDPYIHEGNIQTAEFSSINRRVSQAGISLEVFF